VAGRVPVLVQPDNLRHNASGLAEKVGEELASYASLYKTMLRNGIPLCFGSDGPIAPFNLMTGIH
jgi:predicted amidohydrolase YtcJ